MQGRQGLMATTSRRGARVCIRCMLSMTYLVMLVLGPARHGAGGRRLTQGDVYMSRRTLALGVALLAAIACAGCGKSSSSGGGEQGGIKTGPGVTSTKIRLGVLTDLSGVFAPLGQAITQGQQAYWKQQNAAGGVSDRKVTLTVKDHGYDPQNAVTLYRDVEPKVLALQQLLGSPITAALLPTLERDTMYSALAAWP